MPLKMWRRLRRVPIFNGHAVIADGLPIVSMFVVMGLVCWQCGAMPANLKQCGRCGTAWYCSGDCQRAQHSSHKRWCSSAVDDLPPCPPPSDARMMQCCRDDLHAALRRSPEAVALCIMHQEAAQPTAGGSTVAAASAEGAAAAQTTDEQRVAVQPAGVESDPYLAVGMTEAAMADMVRHFTSHLQ